MHLNGFQFSFQLSFHDCGPYRMVVELVVARLKDVNGTFLVALIDVLNCLVIVAALYSVK